MRKYTFNNKSDVDAFLKDIDIDVPLRSKDRKTGYTENYSIADFILQAKNEIFTDFPVELFYSGKPDFRIISAKHSIGIEVTEAIPEQLARAIYLSELHFPQGIIEPEFFGWDAPERTEDEILEILKKSNEMLIGNGFSGDSIEENWVNGIYDCVIKKTEKLNNKGFEKFTNNWLLIYDNQTGSFLKQVAISNKVPFVFENYFNEPEILIFDKIIIDSGKYFYVIDSEPNPILKIFTKISNIIE
jgi:hypothetical protein